jgi:hypothetical protein
LGYIAPLVYGFAKGGNVKYTTMGVTVLSGGVIPSITGYLFRWVYRVFDPPRERYKEQLREHLYSM